MRTIAILRICGLVHCEYEWGGQAAFWGPIAGVSGAEATRWPSAAPTIRAGARPNGSLDRRGRRAGAHRLVVGADVDRLGADFDDEQRMELLIAVGWYRTICTLCNGLDLPVEGWMRRWPGSAS